MYSTELIFHPLAPPNSSCFFSLIRQQSVAVMSSSSLVFFYLLSSTDALSLSLSADAISSFWALLLQLATARLQLYAPWSLNAPTSLSSLSSPFSFIFPCRLYGLCPVDNRINAGVVRQRSSRTSVVKKNWRREEEEEEEEEGGRWGWELINPRPIADTRTAHTLGW